MISQIIGVAIGYIIGKLVFEQAKVGISNLVAYIKKEYKAYKIRKATMVDVKAIQKQIKANKAAEKSYDELGNEIIG